MDTKTLDELQGIAEKAKELGDRKMRGLSQEEKAAGFAALAALEKALDPPTALTLIAEARKVQELEFGENEAHKILDDCFKESAPDSSCAACRDHSIAYRVGRLHELMDDGNKRRDAPDARPILTDEQIRYMVGRFLGWKLPEYFNPDGGIRFDRVRNAHAPFAAKNEPTGTNLLDAQQAEQMIRYLVEGIKEQSHAK